MLVNPASTELSSRSSLVPVHTHVQPLRTPFVNAAILIVHVVSRRLLKILLFADEEKFVWKTIGLTSAHTWLVR
jgi:hypothetical protein